MEGGNQVQSGAPGVPGVPMKSPVKAPQTSPAGTNATPQQNQGPPTGVKIISILNYILCGIYVLSGLFIIFAGSTVISALTNLFGVSLDILTDMFIVIGIVSIAVSVLYFFIARGLWKGQGWARIFEIILVVIGILLGIFSLIGGGIGEGVGLILINGVVGWYFLFNAGAKTFFSKEEAPQKV